MSTRFSFGYRQPGEDKPAYHLFEDFHDPGQVFIELPRDCLDDMDRDTITLRLSPELWEAIRQHQCPNNVPADFWDGFKFKAGGEPEGGNECPRP